MLNISALDVRSELVRRHGTKLWFLLAELDRRNIQITVESLWLRNFDGTAGGIYVNDGARDVGTAADWALDGIREWAGIGLGNNGNYFGEISRKWAKEGDGKNDVPTRLGSTLDWAYLFSSGPSWSPSYDMYEVDKVPAVLRTTDKDLFNLYCWIFTGKWTSTENAPTIYDAGLTSDHGLSKRYWNDPYIDNNGVLQDDNYDQCHHFAAYFQFGKAWGCLTPVVHLALSKTQDWDILAQKAINKGDCDLGFLGANWGAVMQLHPRYYGNKIEADLRNGTDSSGI